MLLRGLQVISYAGRWRVRFYGGPTLPFGFARRRRAVLLGVVLARLLRQRLYVHRRDGTVAGIL